MKRLYIILASVAVLGLMAGTASAQYRTQRGFVQYHGFHEYSGADGYGIQPIQRYQAVPQYGYPSYIGRRPWYGSCVGETHSQAVRRIRARYSRDRYYTHPRSPYNEPVRFHHYSW